jgi:hypothetical protein
MSTMKLAYIGFVLVTGLVPTLARADALQLALQSDLGRDPEDTDTTCADFKTQPTRWGLVILASDKDLAAAERKAKEIGAKVGVPFSDEGFSIAPKTKKPGYKRAHEDEYFPRTSLCEPAQKCITIERSSSYTKLRPGLFVVVGDIVGSGTEALFATYKKAVPDAYIKYSEIQGDDGCGSRECLRRAL